MNRQMKTRRPPRRGFTLIELLVVIVIIALLVAILAPSVTQAIKQSYLAKTRSQIQNIERGLEAFKLENRFYPGQTAATGKGHIVGGGNTFGTKGSEFLARALWMADKTTPTFPGTPEILDSGNAGYVTEFKKAWTPKTTAYAAYDSTTLIGGNTVSDGFKDGQQKPILYFVADLEEEDEAQFTGRFGMNSEYATMPGATDGAKKTNFSKYIEDRNLWPKVKDRYILVAPGLNREYFGKLNGSTFDVDRDDITN